MLAKWLKCEQGALHECNYTAIFSGCGSIPEGLNSSTGWLPKNAVHLT